VNRKAFAACKAFQQQVQPGSSSDSSPQQPNSQQLVHGSQQTEHYDMNFWHYQPWWMQPPAVILAGVAFMTAALVLDNESTLKTFIIAAGPVGMFWGIFLFLLPKQFKTFAVSYLAEHPHHEEEAKDNK